MPVCRAVGRREGVKEYRYVYEEGKLPTTFRKIPFITEFSQRHLGDILSTSRIREYERGETIVAEGRIENWMFILLSGRAEVIKEGKTLASLESAGDIFGELAMINEEARTASVVARRRTVCLVVDKESLDRLDEDARNACYATIFRLFVDIVAKRLKRATEELVRAQTELEAARAKAAGG